jgi:hypothetical protein
MHCYHFNWSNFQLKEAALHNYSFVYGTKCNKYGRSRNLMSIVAQRRLCFQDKTKQIWHVQKLDVSCCTITAFVFRTKPSKYGMSRNLMFLGVEVVKSPIMSNVSNTLRMIVIQGVFPFPQSNTSWNMSSPRACYCSAENSNSDSLLRRR